MSAVLAVAGAWCLALVLGAWGVYRATRNAGWIDAAWGFGLGGVALISALLGPGHASIRLLVGVLGGFWGLRLGLHLVHRLRREPEDGRYAQLRADWGDQAERKLFGFFLFQGLLQMLIGLPFLLAVQALGAGIVPPAPVSFGAGLSLLALVGEAWADASLRRFKAEPGSRGQVCRRGLWALSRHPNYFFEWLIWVGFAAMALSILPWGGLAFLSPALLLYFLLRVTGIPATEAQALRSRPEAYCRYQQEVSAFVPWFPRKVDHD